MLFRWPEIQPYGVLSIIGIGVIILYSYIVLRRVNIAIEDFFLCFGYAAGFGFAFAKIFYLVLSAKYIDFSRLLSDYHYLLSFVRGGFVFYGGLLGVIIAIVFVHYVHKIDSLYIANMIAPSFPLAHAFGRIGCYYAGCCFGIPVRPNFWHVTYTSPFHPASGLPLLPIQLIEAFTNVLLFIGLASYFFYLLKHKRIHPPHTDENTYAFGLHSVVEYRLFALYVFGYAIIRFFVEFFRYDAERGVFFHLSTSQIISLILIFSLSFAFYHEHKNARKSEDVTPI